MSLKIKLLLSIGLLVPTFLEAQLTQAFMLQNGFAPRKGEVVYQNGSLLFNHVTVGLTDNFSGGVGLMPTFLFEDRYIHYTATLKFAAPLRAEKVNVALCLFHWGETYFDGAAGGNFVKEWGNVATFGYGVATFGSRRKNVSVAAGGFFNYLYPDDDFLSDDERYAPFPYFGVSGYWQSSERTAFISENHIFSDGYSDFLLLSVGMRVLRPAAVFDFGFSTALDFAGGGFFDAYPVPWLGLALPLGKRTRAMWRG